ncbi:MAG: amine oxidase, partial [Lysobacteraceae bacterium]
MENSRVRRIDNADGQARPQGNPPASSESPYLSFWQAGFEGADHINGSAQPLCMNSMTDHYRRARWDYARLAALGLRTVRESAGWRHIGRNDRHDFSRVEFLCRCAGRHGLQILWTCFHYGLPPGIDLFAEDFPARFADYCHALARVVRSHRPGGLPAVYTPVNEISFLAWAVCETGLFHPHLGTRAEDGYALKKQLVRATILAVDAIRAADPDARMLLVDPI